MTPIADTVAPLNAQFQAALRSSSSKNVWQYYELVFTQWPADPKNVQKFGEPTPAFLANSVIETFFQGPSPQNPTKDNPPHSCMGCHGMFAQQEAQKDFVFQLFKAAPQPKASPVPGIFNPPRPAGLK